ncbi:replicative DNA helicase [Streptomyces aculeolatus]|uniref:replicative DNA helicase n=1 Tax=Streptomyces aculeolatus TaxID=270689 RepID=UPI001CEC78D2|nr:replicative DNA helicase [Streptomyces aculeolatus]
MNDHDQPPPDDTIAAPPPHDLGAEQSVLGGMLLSPDAAVDAESVLGDGHAFYRPAHETIYHAILAVHGKPGVRADPITVTDRLRRTGDLERVGGATYLHTLVHNTPTAGNAGFYAEIVAKLATLRDLIEITTRALQRACEADADPGDILDELSTATSKLIADSAGSETEEDLSVAGNWEPFVDELAAGRDPDALDSPWVDLNAAVQFKPKELTVVGAATGGGKSLLGMNLAAHIALRRGLPVLVASMEMSRKELLARLTAAEAGVELNHLVHRKLTDRDWHSIAKVTDRMVKADNFILDDSPALTVPKIRARVRWMAANGTPPAMVVVDYMQLITPEHTPRSDASRAQEVAKISRGLKLLAAEAGIPVVALAQFNRGHVGRTPLVTDFKDSSQIEQDASVIILLHRELAADGTDTGPRAGEVDLIVGKNRNGQQGVTITLQFQGRYGRLRSHQKTEWTPTGSIEGAA